MAVRHDMGPESQWWAGAQVTLQIPVTQDDLPVDMEGWALRWELRLWQEGALLVSKTSDTGDVVISDGEALNDLVTVTIDPADTVGLTQRRYWYHLWRTDQPRPLVYGLITLHRALVQGVVS